MSCRASPTEKNQVIEKLAECSWLTGRLPSNNIDAHGQLLAALGMHMAAQVRVVGLKV